KHPAEPCCALQQFFISQFAGIVFLRGQHIDAPPAKLVADGARNVDIKVQRDCHEGSDALGGSNPSARSRRIAGEGGAFLRHSSTRINSSAISFSISAWW